MLKLKEQKPPGTQSWGKTILKITYIQSVKDPKYGACCACNGMVWHNIRASLSKLWSTGRV